MKQSDVDSLTKLQNLFFNQLLAVQKCPALAMVWDLGALTIPMRILKEKLLLYHHLCSLPKSSVARKVLDIQEDLHLPNLREEIQPFLAENGIIDVLSFSKKDWKLLVKRGITEANRQFILQGMKDFKKLDHLPLSIEDFEFKPYFRNMTLAQSRIKFRERSKCMKTCRSHFPSHQAYISEMFQCPEPGCDQIDNLSHWLVCQKYQHLRDGKTLSDETKLVEHYRAIISHREECL